MSSSSEETLSGVLPRPLSQAQSRPSQSQSRPPQTQARTSRPQSRVISRPQSQVSEHDETYMRRLSRNLSNRLSITANPIDRINDDRYSDILPESKAETWHMMSDIKGFHLQGEKDHNKERRLGVTWKNLTVKGIGADAALNENIFSQYNIPQKIMEKRQPAPLRTIIENSHGCVKPGEMLLVLGRPGAGCTTLLKMLSNRRLGYTEVSGDVSFGSLDHVAAEQYRGQIVMNTEDELFFPTLTVAQTIDFVTRMKIPFHLPSNFSDTEAYRQESREFLLKSMGISHTFDTKVGDEYIRGVSGGERKRVSIIECLATRGSVYCWDNSTRGLDASTALSYTQAIRAMTDVFGLSSIVTLYQAGNGIYDLFDKVLVLDEGKQIYYGPMEQARPFMEELGFVCDDSENVADFLTGVTVPTERRVRSEMESQFPRTADAIRERYENTDIRKTMEEEYDFPNTEIAKTDTAEFMEAVQDDKHPSLPKHSPLTIRFQDQVTACVKRQYQILFGSKATFIIKQAATLLQALIAGSLFYNAPDNSGGLFLKSGALFFGLLYNTLLSMSEVTASFSGRPVIAKHKAFAMFHPAAFCFAQITADIPVLLFQVSHFDIVLYFMVGLRVSASAFFTFWIVTFSVTMCMTAFFRSIGAAFRNLDGASKVSGFALSVVVMYTGYMIPKQHMHPWFVWFYWINPLAYGFESLIANEFHDTLVPCVGPNLVPNGPGYSNSTLQSCAGVGGAVQGETFATGDAYLSSLSYSHKHLWRNLGIVWAFWALCVGLTVWFTCHWEQLSGHGGFLLIPREKAKKQFKRIIARDEETQVEKTPPVTGNEKAEVDVEKSNIKSRNLDDQLIRNTSVFTWKDLTYTVQTPSGPRVLLDNVQGWVQPGMLGALMGSSGAGKTTLLDVLAQRKTDGTIHGSILVDGRPLSISFQRSAGYCEQLDVHESLATVREALEFSALLRQSRNIPRKEKLQYVDTIIDLLELQDIENTLIGRVGAGLSVEQRKRLTIGVELVSKPSLLIFLDEPTSGLDGQAAFNIVRFLRKLANVGQAVLVTIHQPSASLFAQFDTLLLLAKGGKTVYFGDIGYKGATIKDYFAREGAICPPESNPAEFMIDVVSGTLSQGKDWAEVWLNSLEYQQTVETLDNIIAEAAAKEPGTIDDGYEFAMPLWEQTKLVTQRMSIALYRNTDYVNNKFALHISSALFNGFSYWKIGSSVADLHLKLFSIFNFIFVAPGVLAQLQPLFLERRDLYDTREKKSKMYSWIAFVTGSILSEIPYLMICGVLYFVCWYYTAGFPGDSTKAGATLAVMLMYELFFTGLGQFVAAYAPNALFASLTNPIVIGTLVSFCGIMVDYQQIQEFWRYWIYWLDPYNYVMGSMLTFGLFDAPVTCTPDEFALFNTPNNITCADYLADFMAPGALGHRMNLINPNATEACRVCQYTRGSDYLTSLNLNDYYYGWRDAGVLGIFVVSSYALVYLLMRLRTRSSKKAELLE